MVDFGAGTGSGSRFDASGLESGWMAVAVGRLDGFEFRGPSMLLPKVRWHAIRLRCQCDAICDDRLQSAISEFVFPSLAGGAFQAPKGTWSGGFHGKVGGIAGPWISELD